MTEQEALERVRQFVEARSGMVGLDPEVVAGVFRGDELRELRLSDLRTLLRRAGA